MRKIGFGGSCHWCTEAIFRSLKGVSAVEQGWIASNGENATPSEAVIVHFDPKEIELPTLIAIHLHTHSCTANHEMRSKYRSAVYTFTDHQNEDAVKAITALQVISISRSSRKSSLFKPSNSTKKITWIIIIKILPSHFAKIL